MRRAGFEPATYSFAKQVLYPLSYRRCRWPVTDQGGRQFPVLLQKGVGMAYTELSFAKRLLSYQNGALRGAVRPLTKSSPLAGAFDSMWDA